MKQLNNNKVYFEQRNVYNYPKIVPFNPSKEYPEYPYLDISNDPNEAYDMVRSCLYNLQLDKEHYGTSSWNPFSELIYEGDTVLIKPNMVLDENHIKENGTDCLITHPSLVRAVADYALIALKGTGKLIIGDAPLQSCDFEKLIYEQGYNEIVSYYASKGIDVQLVDFRLHKTKYDGSILMIESTTREYKDEYIAVNLANDSMFGEVTKERYEKLRITNYDPTEMIEHHNESKNEYLLPKHILEADVVINMPKPKTHRKAGVTIALKNLIGINGHKDWLPHHTTGAVSEGGDEYLNSNKAKKYSVLLQEKVDILSLRGKYLNARAVKLMSAGTRIAAKLTEKDPFREGSWYGNDTIWRTILDLNRILIYSDKAGKMCEEPQRKTFVIGDLIISGEEEGPLMPTPKNVGIVSAGYNAVLFDMACATIMGFDINKIPSIINAKKIYKYPLIKPNSEIKIISNNKKWNNTKISELTRSITLNYKATKGWKDNIEINK